MGESQSACRRGFSYPLFVFSSFVSRRSGWGNQGWVPTSVRVALAKGRDPRDGD
jgi:hypothetical protein